MIIGRIIWSIVAFFIYAAINLVSSAPATILSAGAAGGQFDNSDVGYATALLFSRAFTGFNAVVTVIFLLVLAGVWWKPARQLIAAITAALTIMILAQINGARAYYDKTDYAEVYFVLPNESAFFIPDAGANKDSQTQFGSEDYLKANKIPAKRFQIPHAKLSGS